MSFPLFVAADLSVYSIEPDADLMAEWLASLAKLKRQVPGDVLVLPAHQECQRPACAHRRATSWPEANARTLAPAP